MKTPLLPPSPDQPKPILLAGAAAKQQPQVERQEVQEQEPPPEPKEDPDSLFSSSYARAVDVLSEGEIEGLCDERGNILTTQAELARAIYLNETPMLGRDGKYNFRGVNVGMTWGTQDQDALTGFGRAAETIFSGADLRQGDTGAVTIAINNPEAASFDVGVRFQSMLSQDKKTGDVHGSYVLYQVFVSHNGGPFVRFGEKNVQGKTKSPYMSVTSHGLPRNPDPNIPNSWQVRVYRVTPVSATLDVANSTSVDYVTVYARNQYRYPNTAIVGVEISARGFQNIPQRSYRAKGIRVMVPDNYFPETREYNRHPMTGDPVFDGDGNPVEQVWTGGMYRAWTNNPAWILFDLLTSRRYGVGEQMGCTIAKPYGNVDRWGLYPIAKYCDELVDDGFGGLEPRFQCSAYLQGQEDAFKVIGDFASVFCGMPYWQSGALTFAQDRPRAMSRVFTNASVYDGEFVYSGAGRKARHTVCIVRYNDPTNLFKPAWENVPDPVGIAKWGPRETKYQAFACCSRGQAHRAGRYILRSELTQGEVVSFKVGLDGATVRPGEVIGVLNNHRAGAIQGGRLLSISGDRLSVTLDRPVVIPAGQVIATLGRPQAFVPSNQVTSSNDAQQSQTSQIYDSVVSNAPGNDVTVLTFAEPLPTEIEPAAVWVLKTAAVVPELFRVLTVEEIERQTFQVNALAYNASKFDEVENGIELEPPDYSDVADNPAEVLPPYNVAVEELTIVAPEKVTRKLSVTWERPEYSTLEFFLVEYRLADGNWQQHETTKATNSEITVAMAAVYQVKVTSVAAGGSRSDGVVVTFEVRDRRPIEQYTISGLELYGQGNATDFVGQDARFSWRLNSPTVATDEALGQVDAGASDPYFRDFLVTVYTAAGLQIYQEATTAPEWVFTYSKNSESTGGPYNQFRVQVVGRDVYGNTTPALSVLVQNPPPAEPKSLHGTCTWNIARLDWTNPTDLDFAGIEIFEGASNVFAEAVLIATQTGNTYTRTGLNVSQTYRYWVRSVDTFGNRSAPVPAGGLSLTTGTIEETDIADFAINATKQNTAVVVLTSDHWTPNTPGAGSIAWNAHKLVFRGVAYPIAAGNTANQYVWWRGPVYAADEVTILTPGENSYRTSATHPKDGGPPVAGQLHDFIIATNTGGFVDFAWRGIANAVIGSASIRNAAIQNAHVQSLSADKLTAGLISSQDIRIGGGALGVIRSDGFVTGANGWAIYGNGAAEFNAVVIRGTLDASLVYTNSSRADKNYPMNFLASALVAVAGYYATFDYAFNITSSPVANFVWRRPANPDSSFTRKMLTPPLVTFYGVGVPSNAFVNERTRLGTDQLITFAFDAFGTVQGAQAMTIVFRTFPYGVTPPDEGSSTYPWVCCDGTTTNESTVASPTLWRFTSSPSPLIGTFSMQVPAGSVIQFTVLPMDASRNVTTNDAITNLRFRVQVINP